MREEAETPVGLARPGGTKKLGEGYIGRTEGGERGALELSRAF